ncbi:MAG: glycosyltransferase family 1 protein, partial [Planctomycetota bacterium]
LDAQPKRMAQIRKNNIVQSLLRHDWLYRWNEILNMVGMEPRPALLARQKHLKKLAKDAEKIS